MRSFKLANFVILFILLTIFIFALAGISMADCAMTQVCGHQTVTLLAGQKIDAGTVTVENDDSCLCITYETTGGWLLTEVHFHIATSLAGIPQTKTGNPIPGKFKYSMKFDPPVTSYKRCFTLEELGLTTGQTVYIAAHAVVVKLDDMGNIIQKETGWGEGDPFPGKNWAMYFTYTIQPCNPSPPPPPEETCETAFAYGNVYATCFLNINLAGFKPDRWGWTNGPLGVGEYTFDIYAAAGQCVLRKGTKVGTLTVVYDNGETIIDYDMDNGYTLKETHVYVGNDMLPKDKKGKWTVAPGQYPYTGDPDTVDHVVVDNMSGDIYVIAHAVVCGVFTKNSSMAPPAPKQSEMASSLWGKIKSQY